MRVLVFAALLSSSAIASTYPDKNLTPGAVQLDATRENVCNPRWERASRDVNVSKKKRVFKAYGIDWSKRWGYEVDHHVPVCLGGASDESNLWPQSYGEKPGAKEKDVVEKYLCRQVCRGDMPLSTAQKLIRDDWLKVYNSIQEKAPKSKSKGNNVKG